MVHQRSCDITDDDILTWEVQLRREGTLPPQVQERLLEHLRHFVEEVDALNDQIANHRAYED